MIRLTDDKRKVGGVALGAIWIGNSGDEAADYFDTAYIGAVLNVAQDMTGTKFWEHGVEVMHVGLIDGPGNEIGTYCAAVLALHALLKRHNTLVCCHTGGRALAVAIMYLKAQGERHWDSLIQVLQERVEDDLPVPNYIHREVFDQIDWSSLKKLIGN